MTKQEKRKEQIKKLTAQIEKGVKAVYDSEEWRNYLEFCAKFHTYSFNNCVLISSQFPGASRVAGYKTWEKEFNRHVKKGEKAIRILAPNIRKITETDEDGNEKTRQIIAGYHTTCVFDVSQTEGDPIPEYIHRIDDSKIGYYGRGYGNIKEALLSVSPASDIHFIEIPGESNGYYHITENYIAIQADMSVNHTIKTMIHETAHSILHREGGKESSAWRHTMEMQAESIAYIVCKYLDIDSGKYSFPYIASWSKDKTGEELAANLNTISTTAQKIINALEALTVKIAAPEC